MSEKKKYEKPSAKRKVMDFLARRDHSPKELIKKLKEREYPDEEIQAALAWAKEGRWLSDDKVLSEKFGAGLHRKKKGIRYINHALAEKGLPPIQSDPELELEKALKLVKNKIKPEEVLTKEKKEKIGRFLISRGFDSAIVRKVVYEKL